MIIRKKNFIELALMGLLLFNLAACSSVDLVKPENRVFQQKPFSSEEWIKGDAHTRGEMALDLLKYETFESMMSGKNQIDVIKILGEPDRKTTGKCCYIRSGEEVEVWLYKIDSPEAGVSGKRTEKDVIQIFFNNDSKTVMSINYGELDEKPAHFPMVG
ncbi:MAG TPA: hypothetical protein VF599_16265 [Pyrinomonadaceae bacterium]|jgi:outer membrane protein assembly factor BamE (lipoprotein component of BamABCDE complex)